MKRKFQKNREGSILLAVVCMTMMCMTLATIALSAVNYSTKASSRNVQRTQAKITAEACLTEFINNCASEDDGTSKLTYEDLKAKATGTSKDDAYVIDVVVDSSDDPDFDRTYGQTKLYIYTIASGGFKVEAETTFGTQTQSASVIFDAVSEAGDTPTDTLEASEGANFKQNPASPIDGDIYIEKNNADPDDPEALTLGSNDARFFSHIYSEYSIRYTDNTQFLDVTNKTLTNSYEPNQHKPTGYSKYFQQAPTIITDGYMEADHTVTIKSEVGKTKIPVGSEGTANEYRVNRDDVSKADYEDPTKYEFANLDGFLCVDKKFIQVSSGASNFKLGTAENPIDLYTHGIYIGAIPSTVDEATNNDYSEINSVFSAGNGTCAIDPPVYNGNIYSYIGDDPTKQNGDVFMVIQNGHTITVNGDMFVEGNLYLNEGTHLNITGTLYVQGEIKLRNSSDSSSEFTTAQRAKIANGVLAPVVGGSDISKIESVITTGYVAGGVSSDDKYSNTFDKVGRNQFPVKGYKPSTASESTTRKTLKQLYANSTSNKIFKASIDGDAEEKAAALDIASKYMEAMTRPFQAGKIVQFTDIDGNVNQLYEENYGGKGDKYVLVNGSMMVPQSAVNVNGGGSLDNEYKFIIKLTKQDIVIAVPVNTQSESIFRIDSSEAQPGKFVYFMYYDPDNVPSDSSTTFKCLYLSDEDVSASGLNVAAQVYNGTGFTTKTYTLTPTTQAERQAMTITYNAGGKKLNYIADAQLFYKPDHAMTTSEVLSTAGAGSFPGEITSAKNWQFWTDAGMNPTNPNPGNPTDYATETPMYLSYDGQGGYAGQTNCIMLVVPDYVKFVLGDNTTIQCILFATKSNCVFGGSATRIYGQAKCGKVELPADQKTGIVRNISPANGSLLGFVEAKNKSMSRIDIQYYQY